MSLGSQRRLYLYGGRRLRHGKRQEAVDCRAPDLDVLYVGTLSSSLSPGTGDPRGACVWEAAPVPGKQRPPPWEAAALHYSPDAGGQVSASGTNTD